MIKRLISILLVNLAVFLIGVIILECIFGNWWGQNPLIRFNLPRNVRIFVPVHYEYSHRDSVIFYKRDKYGFRGEYPDTGSIDILTVGGSTTAQRFVNEGKTWQDVLKRLFKEEGKNIYIANAGINGQSVYGHIRAFQIWFPCVPRLKPKYIIAYIGINETEIPPDYYNDVLSDNIAFKGKIRQSSALWYVYRSFKGIYLKTQLETLEWDYPAFGTFEWTIPASLDPAEKDEAQRIVDAYDRRLRLLIHKIREWGSIPILVTQTTPTYKIVDGLPLGYRYRSVDDNEELGSTGKDLEYKLYRINETTVSVSKELGVICFDLAKELQLEIKDCYDMMHTNEDGSERIGAYLYQKMKGLPR